MINPSVLVQCVCVYHVLPRETCCQCRQRTALPTPLGLQHVFGDLRRYFLVRVIGAVVNLLLTTEYVVQMCRSREGTREGKEAKKGRQETRGWTAHAHNNVLVHVSGTKDKKKT